MTPCSRPSVIPPHRWSHCRSQRADRVSKFTQQFRLTAALTPGTHLVHCLVLPLSEDGYKVRRPKMPTKASENQEGSGPPHDLQRGHPELEHPLGLSTPEATMRLLQVDIHNPHLPGRTQHSPCVAGRHHQRDSAPVCIH